MKSSKKLIVIISIVLALAVASCVLVYLFLETDVFKSKEELFAKYFSQNIETFQKITDLKSVEIYKSLKNENKYESNTNIKMTHSEGGEISNPLNNLSLKLDIQKNSDEQYLYANGRILFDKETCLETEIIKEQEVYGARIPEAVQQFVSVKNDEKIESIANESGIELSKIEKIINIMNGNKGQENGLQLGLLKDKYLNIITNEISNGVFEKQKNVIIKYKDGDIQTNAYSVSLTSYQVQNILVDILENVKTETEILEKLQISSQIDEAIEWANGDIECPVIKITVYEQNQQTIKTMLQIGENNIEIENIQQNAEVKTIIKYLNNNGTLQAEIEINKNNTNEQENLEIVLNIIDGEENFTITFLGQMKNLNNQLELDAEINYKEDITTMAIILENQVNIGNDFEHKQKLSEDVNITLNDLEEQRRKDIIGVLKIVVPQTIKERINLLKGKFGIKNDENIQTNSPEEITQVEINKFNSKFEFYTGDEVSAENVKMLLDIVKDNITGHTIGTVSMGTETKEKNMITLYIERNKTKEDSITKALEVIDNNKKYKVLIYYKEENGLIDYITITEK